MGKGSSGSTTTSTTAPPQWLQNNLQSLYGQAQSVTSAPLQQYGGSAVAGFTPQQTSAFDTINNAQGIATPYYNSAAQMIGQASQPITASPITGSTISQYQSPYTQQVVNATQQQLNQNDAIQQQQLQGQAIQSGASPFGGDRAGIAAAVLAGQQDLANNQTIANLQNQGYTQALGEANTEQQASLGAQEATGYLGQQGAAGLQQLGNNVQTSALSGASAQLQAGADQQQLGQEQLNYPQEQFYQQQAYPYQQLSALESAAGLAGSVAGGTSTTTPASPSLASDASAIGLAGLVGYGSLTGGGSKRGGRIGFTRGGIAHYDSGGVSVPQVPNLSIFSYLPPSSASQQYKSNAPMANSSTATQPSGLGVNGLNLAALKYAGQGAKSLYNSAFAPSEDAMESSLAASSGMPVATAGENAALSSEIGGAPGAGQLLDVLGGGSGADSLAGLPAGASWADTSMGLPWLTGGAADAGALDIGAAAAGDAAVDAGVGDGLADAAMALFAFKRGGIARYASGGSSSTGSTGSPLFSYINEPNGVNIPQLNNSALYAPSGTNYNAVNALPNLTSNGSNITMPSAMATPAAASPSATNPYSSNPQYSPVGTSQFTSQQLAALDQAGGGLPASTTFTPISDPNTFTGNNFLELSQVQGGSGQGSVLAPQYANLGFTQSSPGEYEYSFKRGGLAHYDAGGPTPFDTSANPMANNQTAQFAQMNPQQLRMLAQRIPPGSPQSQIINKVLQQKQMMPNVGQAPAQGAPMPQQAPMGAAAPTAQANMKKGGQVKISFKHKGIFPQKAEGGIAHFDDGGDAYDSGLNGTEPRGLSANEPMTQDALEAMVGPSDDIESQKDPLPTVDHSGDTIKINYPSEGKSLDLGLPSDKAQADSQNKPDFFQRNAPLLSMLSGIAASKSPFSSVAVGEGGLAGLKEMNEQRTQQRQDTQQQQQQQYQTGELGLRGKEIAQTGQYQQGELQNNAQKNATEAAHWKAMEDITRQRMNNGMPSVDPETGDIIQGNIGAQAKANGYGFPVQQIPPTVFHAMSQEDSKRKQLENANFPVANNVNRILDQLEPNLSNFQTGSMAPGVRAIAGKFLGTDSGTAAANIEKGTNDLATELNKFQYMPGQRGSVLGLQTILASKPGIQQPQQTNMNIVNGLRAKVNDYTLSGELNEQYREASPYKITDSNTQELDRALKTIYPLETINPKTGSVAYNKDNEQKIRAAIPDAISNPSKYFALAKQGAAQKAQQDAPTQNAPQPQSTDGWNTTPGGTQYRVVQ